MRIEARSLVCRKLNSTGCSVYVQLGGNIPPPFFPFHKIFLCFSDRKGKECTHTVCKLSRWIIQYSTAQPSSVIVLPFPHIFLILFLKGQEKGRKNTVGLQIFLSPLCVFLETRRRKTILRSIQRQITVSISWVYFP